MASSRAEEVAEILWELKRAGKVANYQTIARRAGFSAGASGRAMKTCLNAVRRDWPHLQWWRAISDDGMIENGSEHESLLRESGFEIVSVDGNEDVVTVVGLEEHLMVWEDDGAEPVEADRGEAV